MVWIKPKFELFSLQSWDLIIRRQKRANSDYRVLDWRLAHLRRFHFLLRLHGSTDGQALLLTADNFWSESGSGWNLHGTCQQVVQGLFTSFSPSGSLLLNCLSKDCFRQNCFWQKLHINSVQKIALLETYIFICVFSLLLLLVVKRVVLLMLTSLVDRQQVPPSLLAGSHLSRLLEEIVQDLLLRPRVPRPRQAC